MMLGTVRAGSRGRATVHRLAAALALAAPGCASLASAPPAAPVGGDRHVGERFTVICHFACGVAGARALDAAETAWRLTRDVLGAEEPRPVSRPIHLYRTEAEYEEAEAALTGGRFRLNRAMTYRGIEAHIAVHPNLTPATLAEFGLTTNTLRVIAHEAAHIALRAMRPRTRDLPDWMDEGLATSLELDVLIDLGLADSRTEEPVSGTRLYLLRERMEREALPPLADLLAGDEEGITLAERYAFYQHFMDFLRDGGYRTRLASVLRTLEELGGSSARLRRELVPAILGVRPEELAGVDGEFRAWLRQRRPGWVQSRRALSTGGTEWLQVGFDNGAEAWRWTPAAEPPYVLRGSLRSLGESTANTAAILIALAGNERVAVVLESSEVRLERRRFSGDPAPEILARHALPRASGSRAFRVRVAPDSIAATVEGAPAVVARVATAGRWGLSAGSGANVVWSDVTVDSVAR